MPAREKGTALVYLRRSTARQGLSLSMQLDWAIGQARGLGLRLEVEPGDLEHMQANRLTSHKGIRLDDGISGTRADRPGFLALIRDALHDHTISHLLIHRRDRFSRQQDALAVTTKERDLRMAGLTLVFEGEQAGPMASGVNDVAAIVGMLLGYCESGAFVAGLADRILAAQRALAARGHRTGGRAPYGFDRVLVDESGAVVDVLQPGDRVRRPGCRVGIRPGDGGKIAVWLRILELREEGLGYRRIAVLLNTLGLPGPGLRRGAPIWSYSAVKYLCANRAILGVQDHGVTSRGKLRRAAPGGARTLEPGDMGRSGRPRCVRNEPSAVVSARLGIEPLIDPERWEGIAQMGEERARTQRGIPRASDPGRYPLSCRVVDLTGGCGSAMYGVEKHGRLGYCCGAYMKGGRSACSHNVVDAEAALRQVLGTIRQLLARLGGRDRLRGLLMDRARPQAAASGSEGARAEAARLESRLEQCRAGLEVVTRNMSYAGDPARFDAMAKEFDRVRSEVSTMEAELQRLRRRAPAAPDLEAEVDSAMAVLDRLEEAASDPAARASIPALLSDLGVRLGLHFREEALGPKRRVHRPAWGVIVFGDAPFPETPPDDPPGGGLGPAGPAGPPPSPGGPVVPGGPAPRARTEFRDGAVRRRPSTSRQEGDSSTKAGLRLATSVPPRPGHWSALRPVPPGPGPDRQGLERLTLGLHTPWGSLPPRVAGVESASPRGRTAPRPRTPLRAQGQAHRTAKAAVPGGSKTRPRPPIGIRGAGEEACATRVLAALKGIALDSSRPPPRTPSLPPSANSRAQLAPFVAS